MRRRAFSIIVVSLAGFHAGVATAQLSGPDRDLFVGSSVKGCMTTAAQDKIAVAADKMKAYCACMADRQADMTTPADEAYYAAHQTLSDDYTRRIHDLGPECRAATGIGK